jgi:phenylalanine-4-hydroxylase
LCKNPQYESSAFSTSSEIGRCSTVTIACPRRYNTPEPDVVHELIGHAMRLAEPEFTRLNRLFGEAALGASVSTMRDLINVYSYTLEFGVAHRGEHFEVYSAGLLSSNGELGRFESCAELLPFDLDRIAATSFDPTDYQQRRFVAPSLHARSDARSDWLQRRP